MNRFQLLSFQSDVELAKAAAADWLQRISEAKTAGKQHCVALSGGRIAKHLFASIAQQIKSSVTAIDHVHFFWADERCVPPSNPESNFITANQILFQPLAVAEKNIHRLRGELEPSIAVSEAISDIEARVPLNSSGQPVLDLILLGMGEDGHVASLFPNASGEIVNCSKPFLFVANSPKPPPKRISLSYAALAAAKEVWVLASGSGKEAALTESLSTTGNTPLAKVISSRTDTKIYTDIRFP